jgi:hypothetical protein
VAGTFAPRRHSVSRDEDGHVCGSPKRGSAAGHIDIASKPGAGITVTLTPAAHAGSSMACGCGSGTPILCCR